MARSNSPSPSNLTLASVVAREEKLVDTATERGYVTFEEVQALYPEGDQYLDAMDALSVRLVEAGVMLLPAASVQPVVQAAEAAERYRAVARARADPLGRLDLTDLFLAEIRQFPVLTRSQEQWLGIAMECPRRTIDNAELHSEAVPQRSWGEFFAQLLILASTQSARVRTALHHVGYSPQKISDELVDLIQETQAWQVVDEAKSAPTLARLFRFCPERVWESLFNLCIYLYALPEPILGFLERSIAQKGTVQVEAAIARCGVDDVSETAARIRQRAAQARQAMVLHNLRLVTSVAWRYRNQGLSDLDLYQEGAIGLLRAAEGYDYRQGNKFSTYAVWWIRQSIFRAVAECGSAIRLPAHVHDALCRLHRAQRQLREKLAREPTTLEVAGRCGIPEWDVEKTLGREPRVCSLDSLLCCSDFPLEWRGPDEGFVRLHHCPTREYAEHSCWEVDGVQDDDFACPPCLSGQMGPKDLAAQEGVDYSMLMLGTLDSPTQPQDAAAAQQLREALDEVLHSLTPRERRVIERRFGWQDGKKYTLQELGQAFGLTRERIRQIEANAFRKLRHPVRKQRLRHLLEM